MKLRDYLLDLFRVNSFDLGDIHEKEYKHPNELIDVNLLKHDALRSIKDTLRECDELKNVVTFEIIDAPIVEDNKGNKIHVQTLQLGGLSYLEFGKKCYLHSISFVPKYGELDKPIKDGAYITPIIYDHITYEPHRKISITFSPEVQQVNGIDMDEKKKNELIELFKSILNSPKEYMPKTEYVIIIRGIFDEIKLNGRTYKQSFTDLKI